MAGFRIIPTVKSDLQGFVLGVVVVSRRCKIPVSGWASGQWSENDR